MMDTDPVLIQIVGMVSGQRGPFDGQYLKEYDPSRSGVDPLGRPLLAHVVCTLDADDAKAFAEFSDAHAEWTKINPHNPKRWDGKPNRPLTAFTVEIARRSTFAKKDAA